jgi:hypothetical protein
MVEAMAETQMPSDEPVARLQQGTSHLVIVSRDHAEMFERLWARFADSPGLQVIFDRRKTLRDPETRERRERADSTARLGTEGFVVVPVRR